MGALAVLAFVLAPTLLGAPPAVPDRSTQPAPPVSHSATAAASTSRVATTEPAQGAHLRGVSRPGLPTVILDAGHGGRRDPGTVAANGITEKELTLDIARRLRAFLSRAGLRVVLTRSDDRAVSLAERVRLANATGGSLFVSIHVNWLESGARGIETFYLEPVLSTARDVESARLASAVHHELRSHVVEVVPSLVDRGIKQAPFRVLAETRMPAVLAEVATLSNAREAELLELPAYREYIALALYAGIRAYTAPPMVTAESANSATRSVGGR